MRENAIALVVDGGTYADFQGLAPLESQRGITVAPVVVQADGPQLAGLMQQAAELPIRIAGEASLADFAQAFEATGQPGRRGIWLLKP